MLRVYKCRRLKDRLMLRLAKAATSTTNYFNLRVPFLCSVGSVDHQIDDAVSPDSCIKEFFQ
uniref:Uncharacterized protein n=1 Tax=Romanomermis culicivorax TaxID=13658 RepID=A0A915L8M5_ROMCU